jgi:hypothetical protein
MSGASGVVERVGTGEAALLEEILEQRSIRAVYQPIVELDSGTVIAWEALARGPRGSALELPDKLFGAAARHGQTVELDHRCRVAAGDGAIAAGLGRHQELSSTSSPTPPAHRCPRSSRRGATGRRPSCASPWRSPNGS